MPKSSTLAAILAANPALEDVIREGRAAGKGHEEIAHELTTIVKGVWVSRESVRKWCLEHLTTNGTG